MLRKDLGELYRGRRWLAEIKGFSLIGNPWVKCYDDLDPLSLRLRKRDFVLEGFLRLAHMTRCKIASNLLFNLGRKFCHLIRVSVLLYIPSLLLFFLCLPPTHPAMCPLVSISVLYSFKSNSTVKISYFGCLFSMTIK